MCRFFNELSSDKMSPENNKCLCSLRNLTPGDFKVVYQKLSMFQDEKVSNSSIIDNLKDEVKIKTGRNKKVGFGN